MGLLDDAIREHLDLKRRRGADPGEVERAEREALGPVRRNPTPSELAEAEAADAPEGAPAYDQAGDEDWAHDSLQEPAADPGLESVYDESSAPPAQPPSELRATDAAPLDDVHDPLADEPFEEEERQSFVEERAHEPHRAPVDPPLTDAGPETAEYNIEDALAAEEEHEHRTDDEDVLEETPEFLQDTPDHDRLWFEQRPPRDFDFDE
jgi:hypothetical protein